LHSCHLGCILLKTAAIFVVDRITYIQVVCRYHIFNRIDDEVLALMGLLDVLEQQLTDFSRGKRKTRVPQDVHRRFMLACLVVLQDGVQLAGASIYICQRGLASPGDLQFGSHGASAADAPQFPLSRRVALRPMIDFVRREFEARGAPVGLGEGESPFHSSRIARADVDVAAGRRLPC